MAKVIEPPRQKTDNFFKCIERTTPPRAHVLLMQFKRVAWNELTFYVRGGVNASANVGRKQPGFSHTSARPSHEKGS